jgi:predicted Zn-dependent protease
MIGLIHKDLGENADAATAYREAQGRDLAPAVRQEVRVELAETLIGQLDYPAALQALDDLGAGWSANALAAGLRGECLWGLARVDEARALLDKALSQHPVDGRLLRLRGQVHVHDGQPERAAELLEKAVGLDPQDHLSRYQLAHAYTQLGRAEDAARQQERVKEIRGQLKVLTQLSKAAMDAPWDADVRLRLAEVCDRAGRTELAQMWRRAARACPP